MTMPDSANSFLAGLMKPGVVPGPPPAQPAITMPQQFPTAAAAPFVPVMPPQADQLPAWATAPVDPRHAPKINSPESALSPAPPIGAASQAPEPEKAKRGRPAKSTTEAKLTPPGEPSPIISIGPTDWEGLADRMKEKNVRRLAFDGVFVREIELAA